MIVFAIIFDSFLVLALLYIWVILPYLSRRKRAKEKAEKERCIPRYEDDFTIVTRGIPVDSRDGNFRVEWEVYRVGDEKPIAIGHTYDYNDYSEALVSAENNARNWLTDSIKKNLPVSPQTHTIEISGSALVDLPRSGKDVL